MEPILNLSPWQPLLAALSCGNLERGGQTQCFPKENRAQRNDSKMEPFQRYKYMLPKWIAVNSKSPVFK